MGKSAAELRALMAACPSMMVIHVGEKTKLISDVDPKDNAEADNGKFQDAQ